MAIGLGIVALVGIIADLVALSKAGIHGGWKWSVLIYPLYLFIRASKINKKYGLAITELIVCALGIVLAFASPFIAVGGFPSFGSSPLADSDYDSSYSEDLDVDSEDEADAASDDESSAPESAATTESTPESSTASGEEFTITGPKAQNLLAHVITPLSYAAALEAENETVGVLSPGYTVTIDMRTAPDNFWADYMWALFDETDGGSAFSTGEVGVTDYSTGYQADISEFDTELDLPKAVIDIDGLDDYMMDAFGFDDMVQNSLFPNLYTTRNQFRQAYILWDGDDMYTLYDVWTPIPIEVGEDGTIWAEFYLNEGEDLSMAEAWEITLDVEKADTSPYGCHITSCTVQYVDTVPYDDPDTADYGSSEVYEAPEVPSSPTGFTADGQVFPESSYVYLTDADLAGLSKEMLGFARNEIFARNESIFRKDKYKNHYEQYAWYQSIPNKRYDVAPEDLTPVEQANVRLIQQYEAS